MPVMAMDTSATALCEQLDDVRAAVRRQVWGEEPSSPGGRDARAADGAEDERADEAMRRRQAREGGLRVVRELRTKSRMYTRVPHHPSVSKLAAAAAHDAGLGVKPRYGHASRIPYPRELRNDPGTLTRARRKRAAARRARSTDASARARMQQLEHQRESERQTIELAISCAELEGVQSMQARQSKDAKLAVCVQARLLLWRGGCWKLYGRTEPVRHGERPAFAKSFLLGVPRKMLEAADELHLPPSEPSSWEAGGMQCRVELHYRWGARATDATRPAAGEALIGCIEFSILRIMDTPGRCIATRLQPSGRLAVRAILVTEGLHQQATVRLRASLSTAAQASTTSSTSDHPATSSSYFFTLSREVGEAASALSPFELVARSENIVSRRTKTLGCRDMSLSAHKLCYGDFENRLQVSIFLYDALGQHKLVGEGTFRPADALRFPAPIGSPSSHLRVQTMSALDVSCVSQQSIDSSTIRLGSRPNSPQSDQGSESSHDSWDVLQVDDDDHGSNGGSHRSSTVELSDTAESDPFAMFHCPLYSHPDAPSTGDRIIIGALRISLGLSATKEIQLSSRASQTAAGELTHKKGSDRVPMLHESLDGNYLRTIMSDDKLVMSSDQARHAEEALCHLAERRSAVSRLAELQRLQRSTTAYLQQSLRCPDVGRTMTETAEDRDARLFAVLHRGAEREHWLRSEEQEAEELGEIETVLSQPQRRRKQEALAQQELAERVSQSRQSENDSFTVDRKDEEMRCFHPTEAVQMALAQVAQHQPQSSSSTAVNNWGSSWRGSSSRRMSQNGTSQPSRSTISATGQTPEDMEEAHDPSGLMRASLLFTEALNTQIIYPGLSQNKTVAQPSILQETCMQLDQLVSSCDEAQSIHRSGSPTKQAVAHKSSSRQRPRSAGRAHVTR